MYKRGSRYEHTEPFRYSNSRAIVFQGIRPRHVVTQEGALEHTLSVGDRLDLLALNYYNDPTRWWLILDANPEIICGAELTLEKYIGAVILIPRAKQPGAGH